MPLSLTTRRRQQTLSAKWSTQQHLAQHLIKDVTATSTNNLLRSHYHPNNLNQAVRKQKSFIEPSHLSRNILSAHTGRAYLSRGLSVERSNDIQRFSFSKQVLKKHSSIVASARNCNEKNEHEPLKTRETIKRNLTSFDQSHPAGEGGGGIEFLRNSRRAKAWSSTSSILKTLDKELAQLNGVVAKCQDVKSLKVRGDIVDNVKPNKSKADDIITSGTTQSSHSNRKQIKPEVNKVNLSIVLSHALDSTKEENEGVFSDQELDEEDSDDMESNTGKITSSQPKLKDSKKFENLSSSQKPTASTLSAVPAQQRRALYHSSRLATNLALSTNYNNSTAPTSGIQNPNNFNASPSLTVKKRPPLVRAMSAPVRSFDESSKNATTFLANKRKSRRRKLNTRNISCDKGSSDLLTTKDLNFDSKTTTNRKVLTRSKSVAPDVITLVSLISSEGSDSEKEDCSLTPHNLQAGSPIRRAPSLRKTGKSVSFQENYPPTFQFASKEYSHMLRRGSIGPLAQRIKSNRPPTAPPGSIYHTQQKLNNDMPASNIESSEEKENNMDNIKNNENNTLLSPTAADKALGDEYEFPDYVRSLKERECWKLYMKMSAKGVNISYDTILRGMLTPTEFRQLQKQREIEKAKALKEAEDNVFVVEPTKSSPTAIERLKESLLKN